MAAFVKSLPAGETLETSQQGDTIVLSSSGDPFPRLLAGLFGVSDKGGEEAVPVLAALMGIYDVGASVTRMRSDNLLIHVNPGGAAAEMSPGSDVARWLFDDDLLISSALGLL